ncbi:MAG: ribonuclease H-like domain-containing protein [Nitrosotalea sp.]
MKTINPKDFKCEHRHNGVDHRNCYINYLVDEYPEKVGYLDIESSNLNADFGIVYTWCIKPRGKNTIVYDTISKEDFKKFPYDKGVMKSLVDEMKKYDVLVTYYGTGFDIPFMRTRAMKAGIPFPFYKEIGHLDLYYVVRNRLKLHSNRLASVCAFFNIEGKTGIDNEYWARAISGDQESIKYILDHNKGDVRILEKVHNLMIPYMRNTKRSI